MSIITDFKLGASGALNLDNVTRSNPEPGETNIAIKRPIVIARAVVNNYSNKVLRAIKEIFFSLSNEATPVDNEKNTSGTTINLREDINIDPTISKIPSIKYVLI